MNSVMETIRRRESVRTFSEERQVESEEIGFLRDYMNKQKIGPMGNSVRFEILNLGELPREEMKKMGTYGVIRGARLYLLGVVKNNHGAMEDLGYCMQKVILKATALKIGTCWLGGTFKRSSFAEKMNLTGEEILPAITPLGYPAPRKRVLEKIMKMGTRSKKRKSWSELFFISGGRALNKDEGGEYYNPLEAVRLAPSSMNHQPWRIIWEKGVGFHLYLKGKGLKNREEEIYLPGIDAGIAMSHFELAALEKGIEGNWERKKTALPSFSSLAYIATWKERNKK